MTLTLDGQVIGKISLLFLEETLAGALIRLQWYDANPVLLGALSQWQHSHERRTLCMQSENPPQQFTLRAKLSGMQYAPDWAFLELTR